MRLIKYLILAIIALMLVMVSLANLGSMTLRLLPDEAARVVGLNYEVSLPIFMILFGTFFLGLLFGFLWEWLRESRQRSVARVEHRELERLEKEVERIAPKPKPGDDVLAILDGN